MNANVPGKKTIAALCTLALLVPAVAHAQAVSLITVIDLALRNSPEVRMAQADVQHSAAGLAEQRDAYLPSFVFNSNLGYSYGFPVGQPSVLNVQSNSLVFSFSQPDYVRAARAATDAARLSLKDARQKVILEASLDYLELNKDQQQLEALATQHQLGEKLVTIEEDRVAAGVDRRVDATEARLLNARLELRQLSVESQAASLEAKLAHLDGLPVARIATDAASIPRSPDNEALTLPAEQNLGIQAAYSSAKSKLYVAFGDDRQEFRPLFALGLNYSRYAEFNNYQNYYLRFQHNNFGVGLNITIPIFDESKHQHARGSAAEAVHAMAQADLSRNQLSEQQLELETSLKTLAAQRHIAELQQDLAQDQLSAVLVQIEGGSGVPGAAPISPKEEQQARIDKERYGIDLLDANFALIQAQLNLLKIKGLIETWAMQTPRH